MGNPPTEWDSSLLPDGRSVPDRPFARQNMLAGPAHLGAWMQASPSGGVLWNQGSIFFGGLLFFIAVLLWSNGFRIDRVVEGGLMGLIPATLAGLGISALMAFIYLRSPYRAARGELGRSDLPLPPPYTSKDTVEQLLRQACQAAGHTLTYDFKTGMAWRWKLDGRAFITFVKTYTDPGSPHGGGAFKRPPYLALRSFGADELDRHRTLKGALLEALGARALTREEQDLAASATVAATAVGAALLAHSLPRGARPAGIDPAPPGALSHVRGAHAVVDMPLPSDDVSVLPIGWWGTRLLPDYGFWRSMRMPLVIMGLIVASIEASLVWTTFSGQDVGNRVVFLGLGTGFAAMNAVVFLTILYAAFRSRKKARQGRTHSFLRVDLGGGPIPALLAAVARAVADHAPPEVRRQPLGGALAHWQADGSQFSLTVWGAGEGEPLTVEVQTTGVPGAGPAVKGAVLEALYGSS